MNLALNDLQTGVPIRELSNIVQNDRYPFSPRIVALKEILGMIRPEPERETPPPSKVLRAANQGQVSETARLR
jgi:hypothetical protein